MRAESYIESDGSIKLKYAHLVPQVWDALGELERTGWVESGVKNPETVQEHTIELLKILATIDGLTSDEQSQVAAMLEVHDWPEVIHDDEVILSANIDDRKVEKGEKFKKEKAAMQAICANLGEDGEEILALWLRFETSDDPLASLARQIDKYQAVKQALVYEQEQGIPLFAEFLHYTKDHITHPTLVERLQKLEEEWQNIKP